MDNLLKMLQISQHFLLLLVQVTHDCGSTHQRTFQFINLDLQIGSHFDCGPAISRNLEEGLLSIPVASLVPDLPGQVFERGHPSPV